MMHLQKDVFSHESVRQIGIVKYTDRYITILETEKLYEAIKADSPQFHKTLSQKLVSGKLSSFAFGRKYFVILSKKHTMCIPSNISFLVKHLTFTTLAKSHIPLIIKGFIKNIEIMQTQRNFEVECLIDFGNVYLVKEFINYAQLVD